MSERTWIGTFRTATLLKAEGYKGTDFWMRWYAEVVERIKNHTYFIRRHRTELGQGRGYDRTMIEVWCGR
jgi:serine/threonine-protein kinase RIO1